MLRLLDHGRLLYGGSPPRFIKLTEAGRQQALALLAPEHAGAKPESIDPPLRGRLVNAGMLAPAQPLHASLPTFGVVIPHFNDPGGAADSVATLMSASSELPGPSPATPWIVVVDDGSAPAARQQLHRLLDPLSTTVEIVDHPVNGGPGAARNAGATAVDAQVIVFVDCGVTFAASPLGQLLGWLSDGTSIAAAAPRIRPTDEGGVISRYERVCSPLDVGGDNVTEPTLVGTARPIPYVPSTVLAVRSEAFRDVEGFDESLRYGEDVDLIWRLVGPERHVVLDPAVLAVHPARSTIAEFAAQRFSYGSSAGPLGTRHGATVAPAVVRPGLAMAAVASVFAPMRLAAVSLLIAVAQDAHLRSRFFDRAADGLPGSAALGAVESLRFNAASSASFVVAMSRPWWPLTALLIAQPWSSRLRRRATVAVVSRLLDRVRTTGVTMLPLGVLDDLAYSSGVWLGAAKERGIPALVPRLLRGR